MMLKENAWSKRYAQRYQWAVDAHKRFMGEVDQDVARDFQRTEHVTVVVYGKTQVGKTTLILDLLGVKSTLVVSVLRGGQSLGNSSTATPIRYGKSNDDYWYIGSDPRGVANAEAKERFRVIRADVEAGKISSTEVLSVRIPKCYFSPSGSGSLSLDLCLLDIPGVSACNESERELVEKFAQEHVAKADLILLVGLAGNLGFFNPSALGLDALKDWMLQLNRFRVVLTYTFSLKSFAEWFEKGDYDASAVKSELYAQIMTHDFHPPKGQEKEFERNIFPLELGDSLEGLLNDINSDRYYVHAKSVICDLRKQLIEDIESAASPYARLQSAFQVGNFIREKVERECLEHRDQVKNLLCEARKKRAEKREVLALEEDVRHGKNVADRHLRMCVCRLTKLDLREKLGHPEQGYVQRFFSEPTLIVRTKSVPELKDCAQSMKSELTQKWVAFCDRLSKRHGLGVLKMAMPTMQSIDLFLHKLDDYWLDKYWSNDNFNRDFNHLREISITLHTKFIDAARRGLMIELERVRDKAYKDARDSDSLLQVAFAQSQRAGDALDQVRQQIANVSRAHRTFVQRMQRSVKHADTFKQYLYEAFGTELAQVRHQIKHATHPEEKLTNLLYLPVLLDQLPKMLSGNKF